MKNYIFTLPAILILSLSLFAQTNVENKSTAKIKAKIESVGIGQVILIRLQNKEKMRGNIMKISSDSFVFREFTKGVEQTLTYSEVKEVKRVNNGGFSTGVKIALVGAGALFVLALIGNGGFGG